MAITDRLRFSVIQANTNELLTDDLVVIEPQVMAQLSAPAMVNFKVPRGEEKASSANITWKSWALWIITEMEIDGVRKVVACTITRDCKIDPKTGDMVVESVGFSDYPKGIPWLENWNDIAVDPFDIVDRIWSHVQSTSNANLGVEVYPASSGTQMLPGYGFDGSVLVFDFFALFTRAIDFPDCGDYITGLARDIPFDYFEECTWNAERTEVSRKIRLAYPAGGVRQDHLTFILGENVFDAELAEEMDIEWASDIIIRGWFPGKVYNSRLSNADPKRFRRTVMEEDAKIDSSERAAAWAKRKLTRRNVPKYWTKILIDPNHDSGQFGNWQLGDTIWVEGEYAWMGVIGDWHRIMGWTYDEGSGMMEVNLKVEGAFNYDPIDYDPDQTNNPTVDPNLLSNGYFLKNLAGWRSVRGSWFRVTTMGYDTDGAVRIDCDDHGEYFVSHLISVTPGKSYRIQGAARWSNFNAPNGSRIGIDIRTYQNQNQTGVVPIDGYNNPTGNHTWVPWAKNWVCPPNVTEIAVQLAVSDNVVGGTAFWDDIKVLVN